MATGDPADEDGHRAWRDVAALGSSKFGALLLAMGASVLWARGVSPETYGQFQLLLSLVSIGGALSLSGTAEGLAISAAKGYDGNLSLLLRHKLGASLLGALVLAGAALYYRQDDPVLAVGALLTAVFFPFIQLGTTWLPWVNGKRRFGILAWFQVLFATLTPLTLGILILSHSTSLVTLILGIRGIHGLLILLVVAYLLRRMRDNHVTDGGTVRYSYHVTLAMAFSWLLATDRLVIEHYLSIVDVAVFGIAMILPSKVKILFTIASQIILPHIAKADGIEEAWAYLRPKLRYLMPLFFGVGILGFFTLPWLIPILFSDRYVSAIRYSSWLWLAISVCSPFTFLSNLLIAQKRKAFVYTKNAVSPILVFVCYLALVPSLGLWGVVLARIGNGAFLAIFHSLYFWWELAKARDGRSTV